MFRQVSLPFQSGWTQNSANYTRLKRKILAVNAEPGNRVHVNSPTKVDHYPSASEQLSSQIFKENNI
jgi:hypothetical protein